MNHGVLCVMAYRRRRLVEDFGKTFKVVMQFTDEEATYISQPTETLARNEVLRKIFNRRDDISIIDAFACVGGDSISFMHAFSKCKLHSVQRTETADERNRYDRMCDNVGNAQKQVMYQGVIFHHYDCPIDVAFSRIKENVVGKVDLLFLDPPWYQGERVLDATSMTWFLRKNVFQPIIEADLMPEIICMKLSFSAVELRNSRHFMQLIDGYILHKSVPVYRGTKRIAYFFHIFRQHRPTSLSSSAEPMRSKDLDEAFSNLTKAFILKCDAHLFDS